MPKYINADELEQNLKTAIAMMENVMNALDAEDDEGLQMELKAYRDILEGVQEMEDVDLALATVRGEDEKD